MQSATATEVSTSEWRWVIIFSGLLVAITMLPYAWAFASDAPNDNWQFMGMLYNPLDAATYLSKIGLGARGLWLYYLTYTPEVHTGAAINEFYLFLGNFSRLLGLSPLLTFHISRLVTGFMMYLSLYHLGATVWHRLRPRRLFFTLCAIGSGLGWLSILVAPNQGANLPTDFLIPESIPFFATLVNPHFPLSIAIIALLASIFIVVFRPGFTLMPGWANGGAAVMALTVILCIVQPQGWLPIAAALGAYIVVLTLIYRKIPQLELNWVLLVILPAIPFIIYYLTVVENNPSLKAWNAQNLTASPTVDKYLFGFGLLLITALPGFWRAIRHFERDGDRFMLIWAVVNTVLLYVPINLQRRLSIGLIIPIVYFAVRALEDYWFHRIKARWRGATLVTLIVFVMPSNVLSLIIPLFGVMNPAQGLNQYMLLDVNEYEAIRWLGAHTRTDETVLTEPNVGLWLPAYTSLRVVYGHPFETVEALKKLEEVDAWFGRIPPDLSDEEKVAKRAKNEALFNGGAICEQLIEHYEVRYIVFRETNAEDATAKECLDRLGLTEPVQTFDEVQIYDLRRRSLQ